MKQRYLRCSIWAANNLFPYIFYKSFQRQLFDIQSSAGGKERLLWRQCTLEMTTCSRHKSVLHWQFLITYFFLRISKVCSLLITGEWGEFRMKNVICIYIYFYGISSLGFLKEIDFQSVLIPDEVSNFCNRMLTNQKQELVIRNCQWNCMIIK